MRFLSRSPTFMRNTHCRGPGNRLGVPDMEFSAVPVPVSGGLAFNVIDVGCCYGPVCGLAKNDSGEAWHQQRGVLLSVLFKLCMHPLGKLRSHAPLPQPSSPAQPCLWRSEYEADTSNNTAGSAASGASAFPSAGKPLHLSCMPDFGAQAAYGCVCSILTATVEPFL